MIDYKPLTKVLTELKKQVSKPVPQDNIDDINLLSTVFSNQLYNELGRVQMLKVIALNHQEKDESICHSHDFCDPNPIMADAFLTCFEEDIQWQDKKHVTLVNEAWEIARIRDFYFDPKEAA